MKANELLVAIDINGNPFVADACTDDGGDKRQSTYDYLIEDFQAVGNWEDVGVPSVAGRYRLRILFEPPDNVENIFTLMEEEE